MRGACDDLGHLDIFHKDMRCLADNDARTEIKRCRWIKTFKDSSSASSDKEMLIVSSTKTHGADVIASDSNAFSSDN